jgi:hypothetical protein
VVAGLFTERPSRYSVSTRPSVELATVYHTLTSTESPGGMAVTPALSGTAPWLTPVPVMESIVRNELAGPTLPNRSNGS